MLRPTSEVHLRDPFVLPVSERGWYYLFGTTDPDCWGPVGIGFDAYRSRDLQQWEGPFSVFRPPSNFWATHHFWAPEVFKYRKSYYMFASFKAEGRARGTQVLIADDPLGPFRPHSDGPVTPRDWECLDGTLHFEADGTPWMVFCHEWIQIRNGAVAALPLSSDLRETCGEPVVLFHGSEATWAIGCAEDRERRVTDGPWLYRHHRSGALCLLWSSIGEGGYTLGMARSLSGSIRGPWQQDAEPLWSSDGGHAMIFKDFEGHQRLALHHPNQSPAERPQFLYLEETKDGLHVLSRPQ